MMRRLIPSLLSLMLLTGLILLLAGWLEAQPPASVSAQGLEQRNYLPLSLRQPPLPVILEAPTSLTPLLGPCPETFWYVISTDRGSEAYLTLNVNSPNISTNWGEWRPDLPEEGFYRVEAYIPAHPPITWCVSGRVKDADTSDAWYKIYHAGGTTLKNVSQAGLSNQWLDLGIYLFKAGGSGYVTLSDLNSEANYASTISFSAMRFTYQASVSKIILPLVSAPPNESQTYLETQVRNQQAFDSCNPPSIPTMQNWWVNSPYYIYNVYLGGASFAKGCQLPNASWLSLAKQQGWAFIPTWVGPQAPCTSYSARMDGNPAVAYLQGRAEAEMASQAAVTLGLVTSSQGRTVIYYDLEAYGGSSAPLECRQAVSAFINGWVERLRELGHRTGVYGGSCSSNLKELALIPNVPDNIWAAQWYTSQYDPNASVNGLFCIDAPPGGLWVNRQRIRQYAGGHNETWGGKTLNIDSNIADGEVAVPGLTLQAAGAAAQVIFDGPVVQDFAWLSPTQGYLLANGSLLWTEDGGATWQARSADRFSAVFFLDALRGWATAYPGGNGRTWLYATTDGGLSWQTLELNLPSGEWQPLQVAFQDESQGWVVFRSQTSRLFSRGILLRTRDGGLTWETVDLPLGETVTFNTPLSGWQAGGAAGNELYHTVDGGLTWQPVELLAQAASDDVHIQYRAPVFSSPQDGLLAAAVVEPGGGARIEVYATQDGGANWHLQAAIPVAEEIRFEFPLTILPQGGWIMGAGGQVLASPDETLQPTEGLTAMTQLTIGSLPGQITRLAFASSQYGWAITVTGACQGDKLGADFICRQATEFWKTSDGGASWQAVDAPGVE